MWKTDHLIWPYTPKISKHTLQDWMHTDIYDKNIHKKLELAATEMALQKRIY